MHAGRRSDYVVDNAAYCNEPVSANPSFMAVFIHAGGAGHRGPDMPIHTSARSPALTKLPSVATAMNEMIRE